MQALGRGNENLMRDPSPEYCWAFQRELKARDIAMADIEKIEIVPQPLHGGETGAVVVVVTLQSGHVESRRQRWNEAA